MTYVLSKSEIGICTSVFENLTTNYINCLERVPEDDWGNVNNEPIYCCTKSDPQYSRLEYCCHYEELLSQHRIWLVILFILTIITGTIFAFTLFLNLYMIVVAGSKADIPNISTMAFLPKPNFFPKLTHTKSKRASRSSSKSQSRSPSKSKKSNPKKSKDVHQKKSTATPTTTALNTEVKARAVKSTTKSSTV
ncbi:hypothetical protein TYRP_000425 [Tyrophagus putrescentiae]|nr:hypothetical protein TYRP_000425 [Tyrophagus putrescentiae]